MPHNAVALFVTGGTLDKDYDPIAGTLQFRETHVKEMLTFGRFQAPLEVTTLMLKDSLSMTDHDRDVIARAVAAHQSSQVVVTHGTDTMVATAARLAQHVRGKTIVLTGAMVPWVNRNSDALFNLGAALVSAQLLPSGVYIAMHGRCYQHDTVMKDLAKGEFVALDPLRLRPEIAA